MIKLNQNPSSEQQEKLVVHSTDRCLLKYRNLSGASKIILFCLIGFFAVGLQLIAASSTIARWNILGLTNGTIWVVAGAVMSGFSLLGSWRMLRSKN